MPHGTRGCGIPQCNGRYTLPSASGIPALICRRCSALHWSSCRPADSRGTGGYPASRRKLSPPHPAVAECIFPLFQKKSVQNSHPPLSRLLRNAPRKIAAVYRNPDTIGLCSGICRCSACSCCFICSALSTSGQPGYCHGYRKYGR